MRWTERRNLACFLDLAARGSVDVEPLISHIADFDDAVETYRSLKEGELKAVAVLFRYPEQAAETDTPETPAKAPVWRSASICSHAASTPAAGLLVTR